MSRAIHAYFLCLPLLTHAFVCGVGAPSPASRVRCCAPDPPPAPALTGAQRRFLRTHAGRLAAAKELNYVHVGDVERSRKEVDVQLAKVELVRCKMTSVMKKADAKVMAAELAERTGAAVAEVIGHTALLYRPGSKRTITLPPPAVEWAPLRPTTDRRAPPPELSLLSESATPFTPPGASAFAAEPEDAAWAMRETMRKVDLPVVSADGALQTTISTTYCTVGGPQSGDGTTTTRPKLLFIHGADSSALEWRFLLKRLGGEFECYAVDWWSGGWTDRKAITDILKRQPSPPRPWPLVRAHVLAFWQEVMGGEPCVLIGTSLGGAVALDLASYHPEAVSKLILVDAGGVSYAAPEPDIVTALSPAVRPLHSHITHHRPSPHALLMPPL